MSKSFLYIARFLSACCIYLFIAKANVWLDRIDNTILVFGYRFFILLAPFFFLLSRKWIGFFAFLISTIGILFWFAKFIFIGTVLFSSGIAVGSYVIKYYAVQTPKGAAYNAVILNFGVFVSGLILVYLHKSFLNIGLGIMLITLICSFFIGNNSTEKSQYIKTDFSFTNLKMLRGIAWAIVGLVSGIEFISMFSILPQYLIAYYHVLPNWYGWVMPLSSLTVILLQTPIMRLMQHFNLQQALFVLPISMLIVAFPNFFACQFFIGAMLWVFILTLFECAIGYLDTLSVLEGNLLVKETFVGVGMAVTVFIARSLIPFKAALFIAIIGFLMIPIAIFILRVKIKNFTEEASLKT